MYLRVLLLLQLMLLLLLRCVRLQLLLQLLILLVLRCQHPHLACDALIRLLKRLALAQQRSTVLLAACYQLYLLSMKCLCTALHDTLNVLFECSLYIVLELLLHTVTRRLSMLLQCCRCIVCVYLECPAYLCCAESSRLLS